MEDRAYLNTLTLPIPVSFLDKNKLSPTLADFLNWWKNQTPGRVIHGRIIQNQKVARTNKYRWRSRVTLGKIDWDFILDREGLAQEKIPVRQSLHSHFKSWDIWIGHLQTRFGNGLFSGKSFPLRFGPESISAFQRMDFSVRPHHSTMTAAELKGTSFTYKNEKNRFIFTEEQTSRGNWVSTFGRLHTFGSSDFGGAFRFRDAVNPEVEVSLFGKTIQPWGSVSGEAARDKFGKSGEFLSISLQQPGLVVLNSVRNYERGFSPLHSNPPRQSSSLKQGETGFSQGIRLTRFPIHVQVFFDEWLPQISEAKMSTEQTIRIGQSIRSWQWSTEFKWAYHPSEVETVFQTETNSSAIWKTGIKMRIQYKNGKGFLARFQWNRTQYSEGIESRFGSGANLRLSYSGSENRITVSGSTTSVPTTSVPVYFWRLNLPYEMGSWAFFHSGSVLECRWMHRWDSGTRFGFRLAEATMNEKVSVKPELQGAFIMELAI